jgi:ABC-type sulfate/molybdate transport systems ATPase subunit
VVTGPAADLELSDVVVERPQLTLSVSLRACAGQLTALVGPSGAGKSTMLAAVAGLVPLAAGTISHGDRLLSAGPAGRRRGWVRPLPDRRVALVGQQLGLFPHLTVAATIGYGLPRGGRDPRVRALAEALELDGLLGALCSRLSGGQRQRVAVARALAGRPEILLLDEATTGLDSRLRRRVEALVAAQVRDDGVSCLVVTHDLVEAQALADRLAVLDAGRLLQVGPPDQVVAEPVSRRVAAIVGYLAEVPVGAVRVEAGRDLPASTATVAFHPSEVTWRPREAGRAGSRTATGEGPTGAPAAGWVAGVVSRVSPAGPRWRAEVVLPGEQRVPVAVGAGDVRPGDPVEVGVVRAPCYDDSGLLCGLLVAGAPDGRRCWAEPAPAADVVPGGSEGEPRPVGPGAGRRSR